jgi:hypothetical protein
MKKRLKILFHSYFTANNFLVRIHAKKGSAIYDIRVANAAPIIPILGINNILRIILIKAAAHSTIT